MMKRRSLLLVWIVLIGLLTGQIQQGATRPVREIKGSPIYTDLLADDWQDWSWGGVTRHLTNDAPLQSGKASIAVTYTEGWSGFKLGRSDMLDVSGYDTFRFYIHGGDVGGQRIIVEVRNANREITQTVTPQAGVWTQVDVPLREFGESTQVTAIWWFNDTSGAQPPFYLDDLMFVANHPTAPIIDGPTLSVDANAGQHPISPDIYGINFADEALVKELRLPVRRWGGNATTRYNWRNDTSNRASDHFFENVPHDNPNPDALPDGSAADRFVEGARRASAQTLLTIPLIGWTPKSREISCGFSVEKYGPQQQVDPHHPDCGNGLRPDGQSLVAGNDPQDTSVAIDPSFVQEWMRRFISRYGTAAQGGVKFYGLDNEPMLWNQTHRDVHPQPTSYDEIRDRTVQYAVAIKEVDPTARTLGPVAWGWTAYFYSALDRAAGGNWRQNPPDRLAHGDVPFIEWYLRQMKAYEQEKGVRILDYVDVHYYPQASNVMLSSAGSSEIQALRLRSTRSLWDPTYTDESWIGEPVRLIPRMREWVSQNYPGTKLAISEYNWGALDHINGTLAQADVLGILGREGVDLAALWAPPTSTQPGAFAFRIYRNYDGAGSQFGDMSVRASSADQEQLAIYAARRTSDRALTLVVVNKTSNNLTSNLTLSDDGPASVASVYRYSPANLNTIVRRPGQSVSSDGFTAIFPASSITLFVLLPGT